MSSSITLIFKSGTVHDVPVQHHQGQAIRDAYYKYLADPASAPALHMQFDGGDMSVPCAELSGLFWMQA